MRYLNIRWRLTLWFGAAMMVLLVVRSVWIYFMAQQRLTANADYELNVALETVEAEIQSAPDRHELTQVLERHAANHRELGFEVLARDETVLFRRPYATPIHTGTAQVAGRNTKRRYATRQSQGGGQDRIVAETVSTPQGPLTVRVGRSLQAEENEAWEFFISLFETGPMVVAAALGVGYLVSSRALTPVDKMISTAKHITARRLDQRIDVPDTGDELARLAQTLNEMIDRLHNSFEEMRRFTADAAHDLRTPVAALRAEVEVGLMANQTIEEYRNSLQIVLDEAIHLSRLTGQLLDLSGEDHGIGSDHEDVRLDAIIPAVVDNLRTRALQKEINVVASPIPGGAVHGDPVRLRRVFANLLDNAIQYTPHGGEVRIDTTLSPQEATVVIADNGPGIPPEDLPHIFDRFRRVDKARNAQSGGTGLGLAISQAIVEAHHGRIRMESALGVGTRVSVSLPKVPPAPNPSAR